MKKHFSKISLITSILAEGNGTIGEIFLSRISYPDHDEETANPDEVRQYRWSGDHKIDFRRQPVGRDKREQANLMQHPSGFPVSSAVDPCEISGVMHVPGLNSHFFLRHQKDCWSLEKELVRYETPEAAREIGRYDNQGLFRPLKTAPNLRCGWLLHLKSIEQVSLALDFFYPAALELYGAFLEKKLSVTSLQETLARQTGMYRVAQALTGKEAQKLIVKTCSSSDGCLKKILWSIAPKEEITTLSREKKSVSVSAQEIPLLCREACNLFVAAARSAVKKNI